MQAVISENSRLKEQLEIERHNTKIAQLRTQIARQRLEREILENEKLRMQIRDLKRETSHEPAPTSRYSRELENDHSQRQKDEDSVYDMTTDDEAGQP
jgi:regulator of replication initiation timing